MECDALSVDNSNPVDIFEQTEQRVLWNYREVEELSKRNHPAILQSFRENCCMFHRQKEAIRPMMSGGGRASGSVSYSEKEGLKGEIKVEIDLGPKDKSDSNDSSSDNNGQASGVDSGDRDFDKDKK